MNSGQICQPCRGSCSLNRGRGYFGTLPGDEIVVSPPLPNRSTPRMLWGFFFNKTKASRRRGCSFITLTSFLQFPSEAMTLVNNLLVDLVDRVLGAHTRKLPVPGAKILPHLEEETARIATGQSFVSLWGIDLGWQRRASSEPQKDMFAHATTNNAEKKHTRRN